MNDSHTITHIQGLRGLAILLIVFFHLCPAICPNGYMGVDVFFIISGYFLLGKQVKGEQVFNAWHFLRQKCQRLLFPYYILIFLVAVVTVVIFPSCEMMRCCGILKACLLGKANIFLDQLRGNYFSSDARMLPLMHLWYMGVMLQSLLLFTVLFFFWGCCRISPTMRMLHLVLIAVISFFIAFLYLFPMPFNYSQNTYYWTSARLWELVLGGLLYGRSRFKAFAFAPFLSLSAFVIFIACSFLPLPNSAIGVMLGVLCGSLMLLFGKSHWSFSLLENNYLVWMGNISFSLYLIHWPCICFAEYILGRTLTLCDATLLLLILPAAYFFHRVIESLRYAYAMLPLAAIAAGIAYKSITETHGFARYLHLDDNRAIESCISDCTLPELPQQSPFWDGTHGITPNQYSPHSKPECLLHELGDTNQEISFAIIGDSHAFDLACGMHLWGVEQGWHGLFLNSYVVPYWGAEYRTPPSIAPGNFFDENKASLLLHWLQQHPEIRTIFIAQYWSQRLRPHMMWNGLSIETNIPQARVNELRQFCQKVQACGKRIVLVTDTPQLPSSTPLRDISSRLMWHQGKGISPALCCHRKNYDARNGAFNKEMDKMENDGICCVLHRENVFFPTDLFVAYDGTYLTHRDNHHLYPYGSKVSVSGSIDEIRKLLSEK